MSAAVVAEAGVAVALMLAAWRLGYVVLDLCAAWTRWQRQRHTRRSGM